MWVKIENDFINLNNIVYIEKYVEDNENVEDNQYKILLYDIHGEEYEFVFKNKEKLDKYFEFLNNVISPICFENSDPEQLKI
jgi:hypothetical protein